MVTLCSEECRGIRKKSQLRAKKLKIASCARCGREFETRHKRMFCSEKCRHNGSGEVHGDTKPCERCGKPVKVSCRGFRFCSRACANPGAAFQCLNCGVEFKKKRFKSGAYSCQTKYCSRPCAFEARRLKKKCAARPLEVAGKLARWFLSWGDDQWPVTAKCHCGAEFVHQKSESSERHDRCRVCRSRAPRSCPDCGRDLDGCKRVCEDCGAVRKKASRRRHRRSRRRRHGNACTFRQRCKKYGCRYTAVSKRAVMERDGWRCRLCGDRLLEEFVTLPGTRTPHSKSPTIDHIVPLSFGPSSPGHVFDNCQAACWACNCERGTEAAESFAARKATGLH